MRVPGHPSDVPGHPSDMPPPGVPGWPVPPRAPGPPAYLPPAPGRGWIDLDGTATEVSAQQEQIAAMLDTLCIRLAEVTGREVDEIRGDARRGRFLSVASASIGYGLIEAEATAQDRRPGR